MFRIFILLSFIFIHCSNNLFSQSNCAQVLRRAQTTFDQGRIDEIPKLLESCLEGDFIKEERIAAYKLLALTYLYLNEQDKAEASMIEFLRLNPEYEINPAIDPTEFVNLYKSMRTRPVFLFGILGGGNVSHINAIRNFSIENTEEIRGAYKTRLGYQAGIAMEVLLSRTLSLCPEVYIASRRYEFTDELLGFSTINFRESNTLIDVPLLLRKNFVVNKKLTPFVEAGLTGNMLLTSSANVTRSDLIEGNRREIEGSYEMIEQRRRVSYCITFGTGLKIKDVIGNGHLTFSLRYNIGMANQVDTENRYNNEQLLFNYLYIENDYKLNYMTFSLGYLIPHYKPKKLNSKQL